jgi:hypothetical protein
LSQPETLYNSLRKIIAAFYLVIFYASASLAAVNGMSLPSDTVAQTMHPTNEPPITTVGIDSTFFMGHFTSFRSVIAGVERKDSSVGSMNESFEEIVAISLHKDGDKIIWSVAPSLLKISLNPIEDIKNLQVLLRYRF